MEVRCEAAVFVKAKRVDASHTTLRLTRLDQIRNYYYTSLLFYQGQNGICTVEEEEEEEEERKGAMVLKAVRHGVEAILDHYPWAAGRLNVVKELHTAFPEGEVEEQECLEVCVNEDGGPGVRFVGARVSRPLHSLGDLSEPNPAFQPFYATVDESEPYQSRPLVALQVSIFECGGFCVSMCSNHVLFDGCSTSVFLQNMGSCACKKGMCLPLNSAPRESIIHPCNALAPAFYCSVIFTHKKHLKPVTPKQALYSAKVVAKKLVYTQHDIAALRLHALSKQEDCKRGFQACSRLVVITAHLWRAKARCMVALHEDPSQEFRLFMPVNMRERIVPGIPKTYVGNAVSVVTPSASLKELKEKSLSFVVELIQDAIQQLTPERFQSDVDYLEALGSNARTHPPTFVIPSVANLGFYDVDFGWGKPTHFALHFKQSCNFIYITDENAQCTSFNVLVAPCEKELVIYQDAFKWELTN